MTVKEFIKSTRVWKWIAIVFACLFLIGSCRSCSQKQNSLFAEKNHQETIDSLTNRCNQLGDSILILNGTIDKYNQIIQDFQSENDHLRGALKQSQEKPVIIYKETKRD